MMDLNRKLLYLVLQINLLVSIYEWDVSLSGLNQFAKVFDPLSYNGREGDNVKQVM